MSAGFTANLYLALIDMAIDTLLQSPAIGWRFFGFVAWQCSVVVLLDGPIVIGKWMLCGAKRIRYQQYHVSSLYGQHDKRSYARVGHVCFVRFEDVFAWLHQLEQWNDLVTSLGTRSIDQHTTIEFLFL